jgi:hypothetical protein
MAKKNWLLVIAFIVLLILIGFGGPYFTSLWFKNYKAKINKNGKEIKAVLFKKNEHKGNSLHYKYSFQNKVYKNSEANETSFFDKINVGDTLDVLLDSTNPSESYILYQE